MTEIKKGQTWISNFTGQKYVVVDASNQEKIVLQTEVKQVVKAIWIPNRCTLQEEEKS